MKCSLPNTTSHRLERLGWWSVQKSLFIYPMYMNYHKLVSQSKSMEENILYLCITLFFLSCHGDNEQKCAWHLKLLLLHSVTFCVPFFRSLVIKCPLSCEFDVCVCYDRLNIIILLLSQCSAKQICTDDIVRLFAWHHSTFYFLHLDQIHVWIILFYS